MRTVVLAAVAALAMSAAPARADTASGGSVSLPGQADFSMQLGYLAKFNPAAGVLNAVSFTYGYGFNSAIGVTATSPAGGSVATRSALGFQTSDSAIQAILNASVNGTSATIGATSLTPAAFDLNGTSSIYSLSAGETGSFTSAASASRTSTITDAGSLAAFYAGNTGSVFDLYGQTLTGLLLNATGGNASASQQTVATASFSVLYDYTPAVAGAVPEPATWALFIGGFGLVGGALRRRRATRVRFA